ncbi:MAG: SpoIIE family protein phosphatase [bacterium]|nr:SpoIIE family protein phosphatase [bacterium]
MNPLLLFTDGIVESIKKENNADSSEFNMYGQDKLIDIFQSVGHQSPDTIKDTLFKSLDDVTMVIIKKEI